MKVVKIICLQTAFSLLKPCKTHPLSKSVLKTLKTFDQEMMSVLFSNCDEQQQG